MSATKPINREGFDRYRDKLGKDNPVRDIDFLFAMELEIALCYYHGGKVCAGWKLMREGVKMGVMGFYWSLLYRFCDKVGWTRLQPIPGTTHFERHSGKCDKLNCDDMDCVSNGIPLWFQKLTRMPRL